MSDLQLYPDEKIPIGVGEWLHVPDKIALCPVCNNWFWILILGVAAKENISETELYIKCAGIRDDDPETEWAHTLREDFAKKQIFVAEWFADTYYTHAQNSPTQNKGR